MEDIRKRYPALDALGDELEATLDEAREAWDEAESIVCHKIDGGELCAMAIAVSRGLDPLGED